MKTWTGRLEWVDLGMGQHVLRLPDGRALPIFGEVPADLVDRDVEVLGEEIENIGFGLTSSPSGIRPKEIKAS